MTHTHCGSAGLNNLPAPLTTHPHQCTRKDTDPIDQIQRRPVHHSGPQHSPYLAPMVVDVAVPASVTVAAPAATRKVPVLRQSSYLSVQNQNPFACNILVTIPVRNSPAKYRRPLGPRWQTISSASCGGIQPTSSMSCSDAVFKFNGRCNVAMIQSDVQSVMSKNDKTTNCAHEKNKTKPKHKKYTNAQSHQ